MNKNLLSAASAGVLAVFAPAAAQAGAFHLQEHSVRALGRAYSGEVADTGPSSLWWNPASIARSSRELHVGANVIIIDSEVRDTGTNLTLPIPPAGLTLPAGGQPVQGDPVQGGVAPSFGVALPIGDRLALGLSLAAPYTLTSEYDDNSFARYNALTSDLLTIDVQGTLAVKVTEFLDLGVGVSAEYSDATLSNALPNLAPGAPDGFQELTGDGWDYGWVAGGQAHFERVSFGLSYRSAIEHNLDGNVSVSGLLGPLAGSNGNVPGQATFTTPWIINAGARFRLTPEVTLNTQISRFGWSEFDAIEVTTPAGTSVLDQGYDDTTNWSVGVDYALNPTFTLRAGVQFDETPTPELGRTARVPDSDRRLWTLGASSQLRDNLGLDLAAGFVDFEGGSIIRNEVIYEGTAAATPHRLRAQGKGRGLILSAGLRWGF